MSKMKAALALFVGVFIQMQIMAVCASDEYGFAVYERSNFSTNIVVDAVSSISFGFWHWNEGAGAHIQESQTFFVVTNREVIEGVLGRVKEIDDQNATIPLCGDYIHILLVGHNNKIAGWISVNNDLKTISLQDNIASSATKRIDAISTNFGTYVADILRTLAQASEAALGQGQDEGLAGLVGSGLEISENGPRDSLMRSGDSP